MKKSFSDPKMTKCEQPLDKVTMAMGCYGRPKPDFNGDFNGGPVSVGRRRR
jgi:hypothetical protein